MIHCSLQKKTARKQCCCCRETAHAIYRCKINSGIARFSLQQHGSYISSSEDLEILACVFLIQNQRVTVRQTDRQTEGPIIYCVFNNFDLLIRIHHTCSDETTSLTISAASEPRPEWRHISTGSAAAVSLQRWRDGLTLIYLTISLCGGSPEFLPRLFIYSRLFCTRMTSYPILQRFTRQLYYETIYYIYLKTTVTTAPS